MVVTNSGDSLETEAYAELCRALAQRATPSDWEFLSRSEWLLRVAIAENEGVAPLLYWHFKQQGWPPSTPDEARTRLTHAYYVTFARNALLLAELDRVAAALKDDNITVAAVKGVALVCQLYPSIGLRPMGDIDLLVPRPEVDRAAAFWSIWDMNALSCSRSA